MICMPGYSYGGHEAYQEVPAVVRPWGQKICIIGGEKALAAALPVLLPVLDEHGFTVTDTIVYGEECTMERGQEIAAMPAVQAANVLFAVGGGKAIDTVKVVVGHCGHKPFFTFPTIAATCAAVSRVAAVYTPDHKFSCAYYNPRPAEHCFIDGDIIAASPTRFLCGGIGDTMAKHYESSFSARGYDTTYEEEWGVTMGVMCAEPLLTHGVAAVEAAKQGVRNEAFDRVVKTIVVVTGYVSGLLPEDLNSSVAHATAYGLHMHPHIARDFLHGEEVAYGVQVLLTMDGQTEALEKVRVLCKAIGLPTQLADFGITTDDLDICLDKALSLPDVAVSPYPITRENLRAAMIAVG